MKAKSREKRHFIRFDKKFGVNYISVHGEHEIAYGDMADVITADASVSGIRLISRGPSELESGDDVEMEIRVTETNDFIDALGKVKWKQNVGDEIHYGIEFLAVNRWDSYADIIDNSAEEGGENETGAV